MDAVTFELIKTDPKTRARRGRLHTPHGDIETPVFMPVGTAGDSESRDAAGAGGGPGGGKSFSPIPTTCICGRGTISYGKAGGLHKFMNWDRADSHGQRRLSGVFSLGKLRGRSAKKGSCFRVTYRRLPPHADAGKSRGNPERSGFGHHDGISTNARLIRRTGTYVKNSLERTTRWLKRCKAAHRDTERQSLFGIMQGGMYKELR